MMKNKLSHSLALSALIMAMSAPVANAVELPDVGKFRKDAAAFFGGKVNSQIKVYAVSKSKGKYGDILLGQGWRLDYTRFEDGEELKSIIPNSPNTAVYVNVADPELRWAELATFFENFNGVIVIDSNQVARLPEAKTPKDYTFSGVGPVLDEGYNKLLAKSTKVSGNFAPVATAVIVSMRLKKITPLNIDFNQTVNGFPSAQLQQFIDLKNFMYANGKFPTPAMRAEGEKPVPEFQQYVEMTEQVDGVNAVARIQLNAYLEKNKDGTPASPATWKTDTLVFTGATARKCWNSGLKCGIYPQTNASLVSVINNPTNGQKLVRSYLTRHAAYVKAFASKSISDHSLQEEEWQKAGLVDDDAERTYEVGQSFGSDFRFTQDYVSLPTLIKDTVPYSFLANKIYPSWKGGTVAPDKEDNTYYYPNPSVNTPLEYHEVTSSAVLDDKYKEEAEGVFLSKGNFEEAYLNKVLSGKKEESPPANVKSCSYGEGEFETLPRPSMAFEGWQPSVMATHEYEPEAISYPALSGGMAYPGKIKIQAGLQWSRSKALYYPVTVKCLRKRGIFRKPEVVNYAAFSKTRNPASLNKVALNKSQEQYSRGVTINVYHPGFK
jgi:hypothetical protein